MVSVPQGRTVILLGSGVCPVDGEVGSGTRAALLVGRAGACPLGAQLGLGPVVGGPCQGVRLRQLWAQRRPAASEAVILPII